MIPVDELLVLVGELVQLVQTTHNFADMGQEILVRLRISREVFHDNLPFFGRHSFSDDGPSRLAGHYYKLLVEYFSTEPETNV